MRIVLVWGLGAALCTGGCTDLKAGTDTFVEGGVMRDGGGMGDATADDGGPDARSGDSGHPSLDAGRDAGGGFDGGGPGPDGGGREGGGPDGGTPPLTCNDPCIADAVVDFDGSSQGEGPLGWQYLKDTRDAEGVAYLQLGSGDYQGLAGWVDGTPPPAVVSCAEHSSAAACAGIQRHLLMVPDAPQTDRGGDPAVAVESGDDTTYMVTGSYRTADGVSDGNPLEVRLSRNGRHDVLWTASLLPGDPAASFSVPADLFAGDMLLLTVRPGDPDNTAAVPLGTRLRLSRSTEIAPLADCMLAMRFDDAAPFESSCGAHRFVNEGFSDSSPTTSVESLSPWLGQARRFTDGSYIEAEGTIRFDYSGDFTFQLWARIDSSDYISNAIYRDWSAFEPAEAGGIALGFEPESELYASYLFPDPGGISDPSVECSGGYCTGTITTSHPALGEWHFYRFVRDTARGEVRFCVDGELVGTAKLPGDIDISNPINPRLGGFGVSASGPHFHGAVDDLRILKRALPCGGP